MSYSNPDVANYRFPAATLTSAAVVGRILGPAGKSGRLVGISTIVTTGVTVAAASVELGVAADTDKYGSASVPVSSANAGVNTVTAGTEHVIPADTVLDVYTDGGATAGAADINVTIAWY